ncbi:MAG: CRISPR-associated protein Csx16 [Betaproteobacteria bacterium]|nr:MAG: CRISPR-associated protein Csx16 [Betaproteobacteria bacterium]
MTTFFITRHPGAVEWATRRGLQVDQFLAHLDPAVIAPGDTVIGVLPVNLAARVCVRGARYFNLSLDLPAEARGRELSADELEAYDARLEAYDVSAIAGSPSDPQPLRHATDNAARCNADPGFASLAGIARGADTSNVRERAERT